MKVCPKCGNLVADDLNFCMKCGTSVANLNRQEQPVMQPVNNDYVPQVTKGKNKKGKKNNKAVKIIAIILAVILLLGGIAALVIGIINGNETKGDDVKYIKDFPTVKNRIELIVYDAELFPAEEYEIKVEKFAVGGALRGISLKSEVLREVSTEEEYELNLENGSYRITLTDMAAIEENTTSAEASTDATQSEWTYGKIVIDVKVDDKAEESADKLDLKTIGSEKDASADYIEATDAEIEDFVVFLNKTYGRTMQDSEETFDTVEDLLLMFERSHSTSYEYFFGDVEYEQISSNGVYEVRLPKEKVRWLCENIFNIEYRENLVYEESGRYEGSSTFENGYFCVPEWAASAPLISTYELVSYEVVDGKYHMIVDVREEQWETDGYEYSKTLDFIAEIRIIDGERYWSVCSIERYDPSTATQQPTEESVDKISADDIINVYMNNKSVWYNDFENFDCDGYSSFYAFLDLDFDGIPELITTGMAGSGRYSSNKFYKLNSEKNGIVEITYDVESEMMYDFYSTEVRPVLLKNNQNNSYVYWCSDFINAGAYGSGFTYGTLEYKNGKLIQNNMFSTGTVNEAGVESVYYNIIDGENYNPVSEAEYNRQHESFMSGYTNVNIQTEFISAEEFASASQAQQKDLFKRSLKAFNFSGYVSLVE